MVRSAKSKYSSEIISKKQHKPKYLFNTINSVLNPLPCYGPEASLNNCKTFLDFFVVKVEKARFNISISVIMPFAFHPGIPTFEKFEPLSFAQLSDIVSHMKCSTSAIDILPSCFFDVFDTIGPDLLSIINESLATGAVPASFSMQLFSPS